jgi:hypothetical protein
MVAQMENRGVSDLRNSFFFFLGCWVRLWVEKKKERKKWLLFYELDMEEKGRHGLIRGLHARDMLGVAYVYYYSFSFFFLVYGNLSTASVGNVYKYMHTWMALWWVGEMRGVLVLR